MIDVIIQKDLYYRSLKEFSDAEMKYNIKFLIADVLDEKQMLAYHNEGAKCFVLGAETYSVSFYESISSNSVIIRYGVGYNAVPVEVCKQRNIKVAFTPGTLTDSVAEHTMAMLLSMNRNIPQLHNSMKNKQWQGMTGNELKGKTIAILGFGQIGKAVARMAKYGFQMKVNAYDIIPNIHCDYVDFYSTKYEDVVSDADIISVHIAVMPKTIGFINKERIAQCKTGAQFINISRGNLVEEKALYEALKSKKFSKAAIDVFIQEPYIPTEDADFRDLDNVVLTPHCGSNTEEASSRMATMVIDNILAYAQNKEMCLIPEMR